MSTASEICRFCGAVCSPGNRCHNCGDYDEAKHRAQLLELTQIQPPAALDAMARKVLSYKPKPKSKPAKARKRRAAKIAKGIST